MSYRKIGAKASETMKAYLTNSKFEGASPKYYPCERGGYRGYTQTSTIICKSGVLYLMGEHFPLVVKTKDVAGNALYIINGDKYGTQLTSRYQREAIRMFTPNIQVPFSALTAAHGGRVFGSEIAQRIVAGKIEVVAHNPDETIRTGMKWSYESGKCMRVPMTAADDASDEITTHRLGAVLLRFSLDSWGRRADGSYGRFDETPRLYLSDWDVNEQEHYFFTQLPADSVARTVAEAYADLVPGEVKQAQAQGLPVYRQGDLFFVKAAEFKARGTCKIVSRQIGSTSHYASEVRAVLPTVAGNVADAVEVPRYVRGSITHKPEHEGARHARLALAGGWWRVVKNTATGSWEARGEVD